MTKHLRALALANIALASVFLMPLFFWVIAEYFSSGTLMVTLPKVDYTAEALADIQTTTDIEKLRHRAKVLTEMQDFDRESREIDTVVRKQLFQFLWIVIGFSGVAFSLNAGAIWWLGKPRRQ